jgi:hypothetical protein
MRFENHPDLRRLLLPPDWEGIPAKDFPLEFVENAWTEKHLPIMTEVSGRATSATTRLRSGNFVSASRANDARHLSGGKDVMSKDK